MQYQNTTEPGFQTKDYVLQSKTKKMSFFPHRGMAILTRQHQQSAALTLLLPLKMLSQEKQTNSDQKHQGAEKCCAPRHGGREGARLSPLPAQGLLQPVFRLQTPRAEMAFLSMFVPV